MGYTHVALKPSYCIALVLLIYSSLLFLPFSVLAEEGPKDPVDWHFSGDNTIRLEYYGVSGDETASPYRFTGFQPYDDFNLNFSRRKTPYDTWRGQLFGVINYSDYRSADEGFIPERIYLFREKGDTSLPRRFEVGNYFGFYSFRTLQRSLKGIQVELQPGFGTTGFNHSLLFSSGADQPGWRNFKLEESYFNGFSYLIEGSRLGRWSLNFVHNAREGDETAGTLRRAQQVYSLSGEKNAHILQQSLTFEGEAGYFTGDHNGITDPQSGQDREDTGLYLQLSGRSRIPFSYRVRYEQYGQDYRPQGGVVTPDRRSGEGHAGWRFASGLQLRARIQNFREGYETFNPTDTSVYGINLSGPMLARRVKNLSGNLDIFFQGVGNRDRSTDIMVKTANLNLNKSLGARWTGRLGIFYQDTDNKVAGSSDTTTTQVNLSADRSITLIAFKGTFTPGLGVRKIDDPTNEGLDILPTLAINVRRGFHSLGYNLGLNNQQKESAAGIDVATYSQNLSYRFTKEQNTIGLEFRSEHRKPDPGENTDSYMVGVFWTRRFEKAVRRVDRKAVPIEEARDEALAPPREKAGMVDISQFALGAQMVVIEEKLKAANITGAVELPNLLIYEKSLIEDIDQRQRLALVHEAGRLKKVALIIEFEDVGRPDNMIQTFEQVRRILLNRYGRPSNIFDRGEVSPSLLDDIEHGNFIRITEWSRPEGLIRFGIPRRLDKQVRMEVQFAKEFPPVTDTLWSIEEVR